MHSSNASILCALSLAVLSCTESETNPVGPSSAPIPAVKGDTTVKPDTTDLPGIPDTTTKPRTTGMQLGTGGYVTSGAWKGYAWTLALVTGSTVAPADYSAITSVDTRLCAQGTVGKDPDYGGVVMVGISLNQEALPPAGAAEPPSLQYTPTGSGIRYQIANPGGSDLRIQIQDHSGTAAGRWCADVSGASGVIAWEDFNTTCWSPATGKTYAREPLKDVSIVAPGKNTVDVPVDFCLENLSEEP
ncbi:MAG TPA: hypothetical protein PKO15_03480 [Fibrobacteria bacterium]|nr:hypothetical protein [Fibrobacteria bacterium]HOX52935.1 hypothetical protein [Fibrobacteria bacterium]